MAGDDLTTLRSDLERLTERVAVLEASGTTQASCWSTFCIVTGMGTGRCGKAVIAVYLIAQWIFFSCTIILYNKYILSTLDFHFPLSLVLMHMCFVTLCCQVWKRMGWAEVPSISWRDVGTRFVPVAVFFGGSLAFSNAAYLYITVAYIQMIKASTPVFVLLASFAFGVEKPSWMLAIWIVIIVTGVTTASAAQEDIVWMGVVLQILSMICESLRLALINKILVSRGLKLKPIAFLYYMAPLCAVVLFIPWTIREAPIVFTNATIPSPVILASNASIAFLLNLATMALIKFTSALTLNVSGVFKDLLLILYSVFVNGATVTPVQYVGYSIAACGVAGYSEYKRRLGLKPKPTEEPPPPVGESEAAAGDEEERVAAEVAAASKGAPLELAEEEPVQSTSKRKAGARYASFVDEDA